MQTHGGGREDRACQRDFIFFSILWFGTFSKDENGKQPDWAARENSSCGRIVSLLGPAGKFGRSWQAFEFAEIFLQARCGARVTRGLETLDKKVLIHGWKELCTVVHNVQLGNSL